MTKFLYIFIFALFSSTISIKAQNEYSFTSDIEADTTMFKTIIDRLFSASIQPGLRGKMDFLHRKKFVDPRPLTDGFDVNWPVEEFISKDSIRLAFRQNILKSRFINESNATKDANCILSDKECPKKGVSFNTIIIGTLRKGGPYCPEFEVDEHKNGIEKGYYTVRLLDFFDYALFVYDVVLKPTKDKKWELIEMYNIYVSMN